MRRRLPAVLLILLILAVPLFHSGAEAAVPSRVVRLGAHESAGYSSIDPSGDREGVPADFPGRPLPYPNWRYGWVVGNWSQCLQWLRGGLMSALCQNNPSLMDEPSAQVSQSQDDRLFTEDELAYIEACPPLSVLLSPDQPMLCEYRAEDGSFSGILPDLLELVSRKSGLRFRYAPLPEGRGAEEALSSGEARIVMPVAQSVVSPASRELRVSRPLMESRIVAVVRKFFTPPDEEPVRIALPGSLAQARSSMLAYFPNAAVTLYPRGEEAFSAVASGRCDLFFENELVAASLLQSPYYENLQLYPAYQFDELLCLALGRDEDDILFAILDKSIQSISDLERGGILLQNALAEPRSYSLGETLYQNRMLLVLVLGLLTLTALVGHFYLAHRAREQQRAQAVLLERQISEQAQRELETRAMAERRLNRILKKQAHFSESAGIFNRAGFEEAARRMLDGHPDKAFAIVALDLDRFRSFRELFGEAEGARLLSSMAVFLRERLSGQTAAYGHLGEDLFVSCSPLDRLNPEQIVRGVDAWLAAYPREYEFVAKLGIYTVDDPTLSVSMMVDRALMALRDVRNEQFRRYAFYNEEMRERMKLEQSIITDMPLALRERQFKVVYQPQYDLEAGCICGVEALARWEHPVYGALSPGTFIPILEQNGLVTRLSDFVRTEVLRQMVKWRDELSQNVSVSLNVSRVDIFGEGFAERLTKQVDSYGVDRGLLRLEITETAYIQNEAHMCRVVGALRNAGFRVEMDDFGSGYSSLNTLKDLPVDTLKLDMKFLLNAESERGSIILVSVVDMARRMGLPLIAEGVETGEQAEFLKSIGCTRVQGYYFHKPMQAEEMTRLLSASPFRERFSGSPAQSNLRKVDG